MRIKKVRSARVKQTLYIHICNMHQKYGSYFDGYLIIQINTLGFWADSRLPQEDEGGGRGGGAALAGNMMSWVLKSYIIVTT